MVTTPALLSAAVLLLLLPLLPATPTKTCDSENSLAPIEVVVQNNILNTLPLNFSTETVCRGILLGSLKRLSASNGDFKFTYTEDPNYGPYLESVNGVPGNDKEHTYWELLVKPHNGKIERPDVGIGCYIPNKNDQIILNFTKW